MDIYIMQYSYRKKCLVVIDGNMYVIKYVKCKFEKPFLCF